MQPATLDPTTPDAPPEFDAAPLPPPVVGTPLDLSRIAQDLQIRKGQVESVVQLLDDGNTVPFITRYRKERTGGLDEDVIRRIQARVGQQRQLAERKAIILKSIDSQGKLTPELRQAIQQADHPKRLEDLYVPFKPKKRTLASDARDQGFEPFAQAIWNRDPLLANFDEIVPTMVDPEKGWNTVEQILLGAQYIIAEQIAETADVRGAVRRVLWDSGKLAVRKNDRLEPGKGMDYKDYFAFSEAVRPIPPHRVLAINRGEKENVLTVKLEFDREGALHLALESLQIADHPQRDFLAHVAADALDRLLVPSLERELRRELTERAQDHAIHVFARNLRALLLQPPLRGKRVLAIDPGFRTGCKLAALDEHGALLDHGVIYPHQPQKRFEEAKGQLEAMIRRHQSTVIAIGNGTAGRETEELVSGLIAELDAKRRGEWVPPPPPVAATPTAPPEPAGDAPPADAPFPGGRDAPPAPPDDGGSTGTPGHETQTTDTPVTQDHGDDGVATAENHEAPPVETTPVDVVAAAPESAPADEPTPPPVASLDGDVASPPAVVTPHPAEGLPDAPADLAYVIVNEAGASDYSASPVGKEEFPQFDATLRGTVSIGRRLQDPLSELVKIDPQHVGVGLYQHDVPPKHLKESLEGIIESCVNHVGVDLNTASVPLLRHVAGMNQLAAREVVEYRKQHGAFRSRQQLLDVSGIGPARFTQAAGFLKLPAGDHPFDGTWIHPESYELATKLLETLGFTPADLRDPARVEALRAKMNESDLEALAQQHGTIPPTIDELFLAFARPGRDPREDLPPPIFKKGVLKIEDLSAGMELKGTVLNVVDFGAFIDIGLKDSGLVHISQMANRFIKNPHEVVGVGDVVTVWVMGVDGDRKRVSLTMISPGSERRPPDQRGQRNERQERRDQPPRHDAPLAPGDARPAMPPRQPQGGGYPRGGGGGGRPGGGGGGQPMRGGPRPGMGMGMGGRRPGGPNRREETPEPVDVTPPKPRKPQPPKQLPNLTQAKREGKAYLNTLGELEAFFKTREGTPPEPPPKAEGENNEGA